jgi:hypothetical protein
MIKKIILWAILFLLSGVSVFANNDIYYWNKVYTLTNELNNTYIYDNNTLLDTIYNFNNYWYFKYDSALKQYYIFSTVSDTTYYYINSNWNFNQLNLSSSCISRNLYNQTCVLKDTVLENYIPNLYYPNTRSSNSNIWNKPIYFEWNTLYITNNTNWVNSLTLEQNIRELWIVDIDWDNVWISVKSTDWNYNYYIFNNYLWTLKYTSPNISLSTPSSCSELPINYQDICNANWFVNYCMMDMDSVCGNKTRIKTNWENKIFVTNWIDSFSEENTYLQSINQVPTQNIEWFFTDSYVWNSDLQCRVYFKTDEILPNCNWRLIQDWNNLYCNPNLTHFWVTYNSPFFPYYINETTTDYLCWAIYISTWTQWPPWPPWADWIDWVDWKDWADWINWTNGIDWIDWQDWADWFSCWDINLNHINDLSEDKNNDWLFNTLDCYWSSWANWLDWADWIDWVDWLDWKNGIDWINWTDWVDWVDWKNWLNWETTQTLSDDTKWFWDWIFDKIRWLFSIDENKVTDLQNSLSWALDMWTNWFSIWEWWTSWIDFTPWNNDYWTIINRNDNDKTCDMFNTDWSFAYYSNWSYDLTIDLNWILDLWYADKVPFLEELLFIPNKILSFITNPLQNIFSTLRVFWWIWENTYCYFWTLQNIEFQKHIIVWSSFFWWELIFAPWTLTIIDYLILFFMWIPLLILTVRILLY